MHVILKEQIGILQFGILLVQFITLLLICINIELQFSIVLLGQSLFSLGCLVVFQAHCTLQLSQLRRQFGLLCLPLVLVSLIISIQQLVLLIRGPLPSNERCVLSVQLSLQCLVLFGNLDDLFL